MIAQDEDISLQFLEAETTHRWEATGDMVEYKVLEKTTATYSCYLYKEP